MCHRKAKVITTIVKRHTIDGDVARFQMDFMFVGAEGTSVDESRAKATVLMVICKDDGNLSATEVRAKTDGYGVEVVIRF